MVTSSTYPEPVKPSDFDWQQLKQLAGEDTEFETELLEMFLTDARSSLTALEKAIAQQDIRSVENIAHSLQGASANVGASALAITARQLETSARSGQLTAAKDRLGHIDNHCQKIQSYLRSRRQPPA